MFNFCFWVRFQFLDLILGVKFVISNTSISRISARGNGTCQLSSKVVDSTNSSPVGTIFDPDFDMYARKTTNCFVDPQKGGQVPRPGGKLNRD